MSKNLEFGYGSPFNPELVGSIQSNLGDRKNLPFVPEVIENEDSYTVVVNTPANTLEGTLQIKGRVDKKQGITPLEGVVGAYRQAYGKTLENLTNIYDTGMVPGNHGVELGVEKDDGSFQTSTAGDLKEAVRAVVVFQILEEDN